MKETKKSKQSVIKKIISSALAISVLTGFTACGSSDNNSDSSTETTTKSVQTEVSDTESESVSQTETESESETETVHVSPTESITSELGYQLEVNTTLDRESNKTYKASLKDLGVEEGDKVTSFTFIFSSESTMDSYQGGCGISVTSDCPSATDDGWYQSDDFTYSLNSKYAEITWTVPSEIVDYIDPTGQVLIGFWWSSATSVSLDYIICNDSRTQEIPVDATRTISPNVTLDYSSESSKTAKINMSDFLEDGDVPQAVTYTFNSTGSLGKFTGGFGISTEKSESDGYLQSMDIAKITDSSSLTLTWIIPEDKRDKIDTSGTIDLGFWYSAQNTITLTNVEVKCANAGATSSVTSQNTESSSADISAENTSSDTKTAKEIVADMKVGWNLGNTFDSYDTDTSQTVDETYWGNPKTTKEIIDSVKNAGFNSIRIPVTWLNHIDDDFNIDSSWMSRVKEVVDYAYSDGMYIIINVHHDDNTWLDVQSTDANDKLAKIWTQIAENFKDYDYHLIFEGMNEPRTVGSANEWTGGTHEERENINVYWQTFVDTVRATGGNNATRALIVSTYGQSINADAVADLKVPSDSNIIVSIHYYSPWNLVGDGDSDVTTFGSDEDKSNLDSGFDLLKSTFIDNGIPVIIDEFGCIDKGNEDQRIAYFTYYISSAKQRGIKCFVWDNGIFANDSVPDSYSIFYRKKLQWLDELLDAIMEGANS